MRADSLSLQCERSSRNVVSLCDRHRAVVLTCSAPLLYEYICRQPHIKLHTGINMNASMHTVASLCVFANTTRLKMDHSVTVVTIQAAITMTGRTFN